MKSYPFWCSIAILLVLLICFRQWCYNQLITYHSIGERQSIAHIHPQTQLDTERWWQENPNADLPAILNFATQYTNDHLSFTFQNKNPHPSNTNVFATNCVGYVTYFNGILRYLLPQTKYRHCQITHQIGQLYLCNTNIHQYFTHPAFKNHDYSLLYDTLGQTHYAIDPSLSDYFGISYINAAIIKK